jgi:hypothetical protein
MSHALYLSHYKTVLTIALIKIDRSLYYIGMRWDDIFFDCPNQFVIYLNPVYIRVSYVF